MTVRSRLADIFEIIFEVALPEEMESKAREVNASNSKGAAFPSPDPSFSEGSTSWADELTDSELSSVDFADDEDIDGGRLLLLAQNKPALTSKHKREDKAWQAVAARLARVFSSADDSDHEEPQEEQEAWRELHECLGQPTIRSTKSPKEEEAWQAVSARLARVFSLADDSDHEKPQEGWGVVSARVARVFSSADDLYDEEPQEEYDR